MVVMIKTMRFYVRFKTANSYIDWMVDTWTLFFCLVKINMKKPIQKQRKQKGINILTNNLAEEVREETKML
jgi:hypothetical protein